MRVAKAEFRRPLEPKLSEQEYMAAVNDILGALQRNHVEETAHKDVLAIDYSLKNEILHV